MSRYNTRVLHADDMGPSFDEEIADSYHLDVADVAAGDVTGVVYESQGAHGMLRVYPPNRMPEFVAALEVLAASLHGEAYADVEMTNPVYTPEPGYGRLNLMFPGDRTEGVSDLVLAAEADVSTRKLSSNLDFLEAVVYTPLTAGKGGVYRIADDSVLKVYPADKVTSLLQEAMVYAVLDKLSLRFITRRYGCAVGRCPVSKRALTSPLERLLLFPLHLEARTPQYTIACQAIAYIAAEHGTHADVAQTLVARDAALMVIVDLVGQSVVAAGIQAEQLYNLTFAADVTDELQASAEVEFPSLRHSKRLQLGRYTGDGRIADLVRDAQAISPSQPLRYKAIEYNDTAADGVGGVACFSYAGGEYFTTKTLAPYPSAARHRVLLEVGEALATLHAHRIIHCDLHGGQIILHTVDGELRLNAILDFDRAVLVPASGQRFPDPAAMFSASVHGVDYYPQTAPELFKTAEATYGADVYAFGALVLYACIAGIGFDEGALSALLASTVDVAAKTEQLADFVFYRFGIPVRLDAGVCALVAACRHAAPEQRPTMAEVNARLRAMSVDMIGLSYHRPAAD